MGDSRVSTSNQHRGKSDQVELERHEKACVSLGGHGDLPPLLHVFPDYCAYRQLTNALISAADDATLPNNIPLGIIALIRK